MIKRGETALTPEDNKSADGLSKFIVHKFVNWIYGGEVPKSSPLPEFPHVQPSQITRWPPADFLVKKLCHALTSFLIWINNLIQFF